MTAVATTPGIRIEEVRVGERARKDYGDLTSLKDSIAEHGLLQPIVLLPDDYLLCGGRRLEACKQLGWQAIPFLRVADQGDALSRLRAERDENTCRKDMTPSELVAIGRMLEELKRPEALSRQGTRTDLTSGSNEPEVGGSHATRREVAEAVGLSEQAYARAKRVVEISEDETADPGVRQVALEARTAMDSGEMKISRAEQKVADAVALAKAPEPKRRPEAERVEEIRALAPSGMTSGQIGKQIGVGEAYVRGIAREHGVEIPADKVMYRQRRGVDHNQIVDQTVITLEGLLVGLQMLDTSQLDVAQAGYWASSLTDSLKALNKLNKTIKELAQ